MFVLWVVFFLLFSYDNVIGIEWSGLGGGGIFYIVYNFFVVLVIYCSEKIIVFSCLFLLNIDFESVKLIKFNYSCKINVYLNIY